MKDDTRKRWATRHGTERGYFVEAREVSREYAGWEPIAIGKVFLGPEWSRLSFERTKGGVPNRHLLCPIAEDEGVLTYAAAMAMISWGAADLQWVMGRVEFRLVEVEVKYDWEIIEHGVGPAIAFHEAEREARKQFTPRASPTPASLDPVEPEQPETGK